MTGLKFGKSQRAVENREKMDKTGFKIICGDPTTLAVKGLMMMMMVLICFPMVLIYFPLKLSFLVESAGCTHV